MSREMAGDVRVRLEPLWLRVDRNRTKLGVFVTLFIGGSSVLLALALVAVPGVLLGLGASVAELADGEVWFGRLPWVVLGTAVLLLAIGAFVAAVQLANATDWVRNRFSGRPPAEDEVPGLAGIVEDMSIAAGLPEPPELLLLDSASINAFALGTSRKRPVIGVTKGFLEQLSRDEQRAVIATLTARICAGDILFGTALAALMGPLKAVRDSRRGAGKAAGEAAAGGCVANGCGSSDLSGCGDGCGDGCTSLDDDSVGGCLGAIAVVVFLAFVAAVTYVAVVSAAWIVTLWGRALHRTSYEKADAEGMLLLKDPRPMVSALRKVVAAATDVGDGDPSYDGIFYAPTSGTTRVEPDEKRRFRRLCEVVGVDGLEFGAAGVSE